MNRAKFGIAGLDELLGGGLVKGDSALVAGSAGSGKTTLGIQFLVNGIRAGENGVYVTFEELPDQIYRDSANFGWDLRKHERERKLKVLCTSPNLLLDADAAEAILGRAVRETNAKRIVFDSLSHLAAFADEGALRLQVYSILMLLRRYKMTSLMLWEVSQLIGPAFAVTDMGLSFLLDAIILLRPVEMEGAIHKAVVVLKIRGSAHDSALRSYEITDGGFEVKGRFGDYSGILSGTPTRAEQSISKLKEWLVKQPKLIGSEQYQELCKSVSEIAGVRYAAVRDADGDIVAGGQKPGVPEIETTEERDDTNLRVTLMSGLFGSSPASFGRPQILVVGFQKLRLLAFPLGRGAILLATMEAGSPEGTIDAIGAIANRLGLQQT